MRHTRLVSDSLSDAKDWVLDASEAESERLELSHLRKAYTTLLWAARQIDARVTTLEARRKSETTQQKAAVKAWNADTKGQGQGVNVHDRRPERST
jgi:hypothetical protein